jgi:hypothetical protein
LEGVEVLHLGEEVVHAGVVAHQVGEQREQLAKQQPCRRRRRNTHTQTHR